MKKIPFAKIYRVSKTFLIKHSADILTGFTAAGVVITAIETHKSTLKAEEYLRVNGYEQANPDTQKVLKFEAAKKYIIPVATGTATIAAAIGANYINHKQIAGLAAACSIAETALNEHRDKIEELMGEKALQEIDDGLMKDQGDKAMEIGAPAIDTGHGNKICIEGITGQKVLASPEWFYTVRNRYNALINQVEGASVTEYLEMLYADCKEPYYIPEENDYRGYGIHVNGLLEYIKPVWTGDATQEGYVVFKPTKAPVTNYMETY